MRCLSPIAASPPCGADRDSKPRGPSHEAAEDPSRWADAERQYLEVVKAPPPENKVYGYAWYKLAWVYWNKDDGPKCLEAFHQAIDFGSRFPELPSATKLGEAARHDLDAAREKFGGP